MRLAYTAVDRTGSEVSGAIEAETAGEAGRRLRERGLYVTTIDAAAAAAAPRPGAGRAGRAPRGRGRRLKDLALFSRQLAVLVRTGTPLADALSAIEGQLAPGPWRTVVTDVRRQIEEGTDLGSAMERYPKCFDGICRSLVSAGESSGRLDAMLDRYSAMAREQLRLHRSLTGAMVYPALLAVVGIGVVVLMIVFVLPRFAGLFELLEAPLPPTTEVLLAVSNGLRANWWAVAIGLALLAAAGAYAALSASGRRAVQDAIVRVPPVAGLARSILTARFARLLGVLLESQVPLLDALNLARPSTGNYRYADLIGTAEQAVARGESLSATLAGSPLISPFIAEAIRHGEQSGQVSAVLLDMADFMDEENESAVRTLGRLIEPVMLVGLGLLVAVIALSIFMPLFDLTSLAGSSG